MPPPPLEPPLRSSSSSSWGDRNKKSNHQHRQEPSLRYSDAAGRSVGRWRGWDQDDYFRSTRPPHQGHHHGKQQQQQQQLFYDYNNNTSFRAPTADNDNRMMLLRSQHITSSSSSPHRTWKPYHRSSTTSGAAPHSPTPTTTTTTTSQSALLPFEDTVSPRKKQRLGWGQGLAKYEKKKNNKQLITAALEGSDETLAKPPPLLLPCQTSSESASPLTTTTSSSLPCCSDSPGVDEKDRIKVAHNVIDICNLSGSPDQEFQSCLEGFSANIEYLSSANNLRSLLNDLLQLGDSSSGDSNFVKSTAMNRLLLVKTELSKALEKTQCEIDLFENELRLLNFESESKGRQLVVSDSLQLEQARTACEHVHTSSTIFQKPAPLKLVTSIDMHVGMPNLCNETLEEVHAEVKDDDIDSPGTATSKFVEPLCTEKEQSACSMGNGCSTVVVAAKIATSELPWFSPVYEEKSVSVSGDEEGIQQTGSSTTTFAPSDLNQDCNLNDLILVSNRDSARKASEVFSKLVPASQSDVDVWGSCVFSRQENKLHVKQKLASRKCFQKFKERVLILKFRALQHLWKEDLRLLSIRKYKAKSQKWIESNSKIPNTVQQKHRSSIRSRFTSPAGSLTLVPTSEIVEFTSKLLSDSQIKLCRDTLKMPALVDEREKGILNFVSNNGLVENPCAAEKERLMINPWTPNEKDVFLEKLATYGKDFKKIASYLDHKTTADCVEFYYKNHKSESFMKVKKKSDLKKQDKATYLMTSGKKWNREVNAASLDLLGEASVIAAHADSTLKSHHACVSRSYFGGNYTTCYGDDASYEKSSNVENEREATAADTLAGICGGALSSEAMSSCVTSSVDPGESCQDGKFMKNSLSDRPLTPTFAESIDDEETCSDESCGEMDSMDWTDEEKSKFTGALRSYGRDFVKIARCVRSRSRDQCKVFFSKAQKSLDLEVPHFGIGRGSTPLSDDAGGGRSDTEDAGVLEIESAICSTQSCSKVDIDCSLSVDCEASDHTATNHLQTDEIDRSEENTGIKKLNSLQTNEPERSGESDGVVLLNNEGVAVAEKCQPDHDVELVIFGDTSSVNGVRENLDGSPEIMQPNNISTDSLLVCNPSEMLHVDARFAHSTGNVKQQKTTVVIGECNVSEGQAGVSSDVFENRVMLGASTEVPKRESTRELNLASGCGDGRNRKIMFGVNSNIRSSSRCFAPDSKISKSSSYPATDSNFEHSFNLSQNMQPQVCQDLLRSVQSTQTLSLKKENTNISANSVLPSSSFFHYENHLRQGSSSTLNFEGARNEQQHLVPESADAYQTKILCHHLNGDESSQILKGYPLQGISKKDINGHCLSIGKQSITTNSTPNGTFPSAPFIAQDFHYAKRKGSKVHSLADLPLLPKAHEKSSIRHMRSHSQGSSNAEDTGRNGDVKLFGKILSHPSTIEKPGLMNWETDKEATHLKSSSNIYDVKFTDQGTDRASVISRLDANKYSGLDDFPARSYGFWDGSRIQTSVSSHPDSPVLLARCPVPFGAYSAASSRGDQQSLRNLSSASVYRDVSSIGSSLDYQVNRGYEGLEMQPFTVDIKQHDAFSDLQKKNGIDVPCFQKQARGVAGMNVPGTGLLVGGGCTGVLDPVAAIKMHYSTTEWYAGQSESMRDEESWRGIGR